MKRRYKRLTCIFALLVFIITAIICALFLINDSKYLKSFSIVNVSNISTKYTIKYEKVQAAEYYRLIIYNEDNTVFYSKDVKSNNVTIDMPKLTYDNKYRLIIIAYNKIGDNISVKNPYTFTYTEPTFNKQNNLVLDNGNDYTLLIDGDLTKKEYFIELKDDNGTISKEKLTTNEYVIKKELFDNQTKTLDALIYDGNTIINSIKLYSNLSPVSDIIITNPVNGTILDYNDVYLKYEGGNNASEIVLEIYKDKSLVKSVNIKNDNTILSSNFFNKGTDYKIKLIAKYGNYEGFSKESVVNFRMNEKDTLKPAYLSKNSKYLTKGTTLEILNPNDSGVIFYTLDGSAPTINSNRYTEALTINENATLKFVVKDDYKNDSIISTYQINVNNSKKFKVYLSPSNQNENYGIKSVGYTNEADEMNDLSNYIEKRLKDNGVVVYRNNPHGNINLWTSDSVYYNVDLHLAVHSNASVNHNNYGIETWINEPENPAYDLANIIQNDLMSIYYNKEDVKANRGVKYSFGSLGETRKVPCGILVEIAHHDYLEDAKWIMENKELIGNTIADSVLKYFGII